MEERYIYYNVDGKRYKVPESERSEFEKRAPNAKMSLTYEGKNYSVPLSEINDFVGKIGGTDGITYSSFDENKNYSAKSSTSSFSYLTEPDGNNAVSFEEPAVATNDVVEAKEEKKDTVGNFLQKLGQSYSSGYVKPENYSGVKVSNESTGKVDKVFADAAINSHEEHKKQIDKEIAKIDEEYYANKANEPKKSFWRKVLELPLTAQENAMEYDDAYSLQETKENREKGQDYTDALIAKNISEKVDKKVDQYQDPAKTFVGGVFQGIGDAVFDMDTWDQSIGLEQAARVKQITEKLEKGQSLTKGEQMIVDALVNDLATDALAATFGRGYKAGKVTGESLPFMLETALNPASGLGEAITKKFGKKILGSVFGKAGLYATRLLSDVAGAGIMAATTSAPRVAADAMNRLSGEVDFTIDDDGALQFNGFVGGEDSEWKAFGKAFGSNAIEHFSEMVGNYFGPLGHRAGRWTKGQAAKAADAFGWNTIAKNIRTATPNGFGTMFNDFLKQTQWNGVIGEFSEEIIGGILNAWIVGDQKLSKYDENGKLNENYLFNKDNLLDTFLGVSILGGAISGIKTLGYTTADTKFNRAIGDAKKNLEGHVTSEEMQVLEAFANNPFGIDFANLEQFNSKSKEDKEAIGKYLSAVMQKQGYMMSKEAQLSGTQQGLDEMKAAYKLGQNMTEADLYDVNQAETEAMQALINTNIIEADGNEAGILPADVLSYSSYELFNLANDEKNNLFNNERQIIKNLAIARNAAEGLSDKLMQTANAAVQSHNAISTGAANNGVLTKANYDGTIYYVKGDVKVANGSIVRPSDVSGYPVEIVNSMTGESMSVDSRELTNVESINVDAYNADMANTIASGFMSKWENFKNTKSVRAKLNEVQQMVGEKIFIGTPNSTMTEVEIQQILPNGEVLLKGKKGDLGGQTHVRVDVDSFYDSISRDQEGNIMFADRSQFRSQTENIKNANPDRSNYEKKSSTTSQQTAQPVAPETTTTEDVQPEPVVETAPVVEETEPEIEDFNEMEVEIMVNGIPVMVEVTNQDDAANKITYRYRDENNNLKIGGSTISDFRKSIQEAKDFRKKHNDEQVDTDVTPTVDTVEEVTTETPVTENTDVNLEPEAINWDELFERDKDAYLAELQNQFGEDAVDMLNGVIEATQQELDSLNKNKGKTQNEIFENIKRKKELQGKINTLNGMVQKLTAVPEVSEEAPETPVETEPVTDVAPETETTAEEEVTTEEPVVDTQPEPAPIAETPAPVAPNPVPNPVAAAKDREAKLLQLLNRNAVSDELKADAAKRAGKEVADMFATYEEYEAYEAEAADLGEFVDFFDEGVKESFATRNQQNNSGNSQGNSVSLEEPKTDNNGEQTGQTEAPETAPRQDDNSTSGGTDNGGNEEVDTTGATGEQTQRESGSESDKAEPLAYDYPARKGNATRKKLVDTFGFSNVDIPDSRKDILNTIYDFMMEMSKMLGISPKSIGQGGWLGVDNLRGNSLNSATYQFSNQYDGTVVNPRLKLKYGRISSIAHEWWHSLDHVLSFFETGKGRVLTTMSNPYIFTGRKETYNAVKNIIDAIKKSGFESRMDSLKVPRSFKNYLLLYEELSARAFDSYINNKFAEAGITVEGSVYENTPFQPTAEEMAVIAPAFDNLFKVLKEKEGKTAGTSVLYHIGEQMKEGSEAWRLATNTVIKKLIDSGINVIKATDAQTAEMLRIKEELSNPSFELMTAFHGSRYKFDKFDHSNMGKGEGAQAHGWGTYVAKDKQVGVDYAHTLRGTPKILRNGLDVTSNVRNSLGWVKTPLEVAATVIDWYGIDRAKAQIANELKIAESRLESEPVIFSDKYQEKIDLYKNALAIINSGSWELKEAPTNLYTVEIPEDNGSNYFYEDGVTDSQMEKLSDICEKEGVDFVEVAVVASEFGEYKDGDRLYKALTQILGSPKATSELLSKAGFVGIKYEGRIDGECYVIFNEADAKITGHTEFYETEDGTVYGWTDGKNIYLTEAGMNPNTPVHEYTHLWARAMMKNNPKGWNSIKNLLKGTPVWDEVLNDKNYDKIKNDEDAVASEALSRISGSENAMKLEQMAQQMIDEAKGTMRKAEARGLIQNIKEALNQFWNWVGKELFGIENFGSIAEVTDRVLWDLMNETDLGELSEGQVETQIVTDHKVIAELEASPKQAGYRNVVQNEDGTFSSPMAYWLQHTKQGAKSRVETDKFELGKWEEAKEHPELVDENGHVTLVKPNKKTVSPVAYDPYIHNRLEPVNLQFKEAWKRSDLVYVETEVAETDLNSGYHADKAKLPVGIHSWSNGAVMLSKYDKPVRVMSWDEVADAWAKRLNGEGVEFDVVPAPMRALLIERGVEIIPPHKNSGKDCEYAYKAWKNDSDSDALLFRKKMIKDFSDMTDEELYDFLDEYERQHTSYSTDGNAYHNYLKEPNKDIIEAIKKSIISNEIDEVGSSVVFVGDYAYLVDHLKPSELSQDSNGIGIVRKVNISGVEKSEKDVLREKIHAGSVRNRRDVNQWIGAYRAKRELYNRYFGSVEDAEAAMVDGRLDWKELRERLLSRNEGSVEKGGLSAKAREEVLRNSTNIQNSAVDYLAGKPRTRAIERAVNKEAQKLGVQVIYKTREQMPEGHKNDKGYYDPKTGEVVVCTENASSIADAIQTILHESVAHKGLRQLMGEKFNEFINRVYASLDAETKAKVDAIAEASYKGDTAVATEEYLASLAETMDFENKSIWDKVKSIFNDIINAILGRNDIKIGDNDLRYILRASYNNMVNPRGMETVRGWAQDQMMREEYSRKTITPQMDAEYLEAVKAGDMEKAQKMVLEAAKLAMPNTTVVDENGYPLVVYHGGQAGINVFLNAKDNPNYSLTKHQGYSNEDRVGIYFSKYKDVANNYASQYKGKDRKIYGVFLNIERPYNVSYSTTLKNRLIKYGTLGIVSKPDVANISDYELNTIYEGHDGVNHDNGLEFIVFNSNQVKSAAPVTYDDNGNVIPLSERFNDDNNDIRYRTGVDPTDVAKETAKTVYDRVVNSSWNEFQRQFQDAYQPVRVAIDAIQAETGNIPIEDYENYLLIQNQSSSRSRVEIDTFQRRYYSPIIEQVNKIIDTILDARGFKKGDKAKRAEAYKEVLNYIIAKHGIERNEYYQTHKTRPITAAEMKPELDAAKKEYNEKILAINENTVFTDAERELAKRDALDEYNAAVTEIKTRQVPDMRDYSGLTSLYGMEPSEFEAAEDEARMAVENFEKMFEGEVVIESLWKKINAATNKTLKHSYESGMISRQQYEDIKSMFNFYIPLRGFSEETAEDVYSYARFEGNRFNQAVYKAQGRTSVADDPIAIIMNMAESEIAQGNKNRAKQALYNYLLNRASGKMGQNSLMNVEDVWYYVSTDENGETVYTIAAPDHANGETYEAFENKMQALAEDGKAEKSKKGKVDIGKRFHKKQNEDSHYVYLKVNGVDKAIYINGDPKAAEAINARNNKQPNWFTDKMRSLNRALSSTFTNYSIGFTARNYFRDLIYARIAVDVKEKGAEYKLKFRKNWYVGNVAVMMKMLSDYRNGKYDNGNLSELQAAFVDFMNNGGQTGYTLINSVENRKAELEKAIARMQNGVDKGGIKDSAIFKYTFGAVEFLNEAMELRTRFAAFKTSRDLGRGINTAINDAKEITVNFNTKGAQDGTGVWGGLASYFGWSKYFFNASVQGVQNLTAMAKKSPIKFGTVVCSITALGFMMPIIQAALYEAIGGDDEDYWNIPEYDRQNNLCIMIGGGKYVKMPLPIGFREMYAIGDMVAAMVFDKKFERDVEQIGLDMANKVASVVLPINPLESSANGLNIWASIGNTLAPSSAQFLIQNAMNVDWKGAPLQKEYTYNEDDPQWMKAFNNNPMWMKSLSKWCNENINLDGDYKGMDWSPEKLDNTLSNLGGGIYTVVKQFGQIISTAMDDEKKFSMSNVPFAGAVVGNGIDSDERFVTDAYFDMKDYYDANVNRIKRVAKSFGYEEGDVFMKKKGQHHPKMAEIYSNQNFEFMKEWYNGNKKLEDKKNEIKKLEKEIASKENPSEGRLRKLDRLNGEFETMRSEFVNKMLELE